MAIIDKKGFIHGRAGNQVYRKVGNVQVLQSAPAKVRQTTATKTSAQQFGMASSTAKVLRHIFAGPSHGADAGMANRLTQTVLRAMRGAEKADFDLRDLHQATLSELEGFQFNKLSPLHEVLAVQADLSISEGGSVKVNLPAIEKDALYFPKYSSHCILRLLVVAVDFKNETYQYLGHQDIKIANGRSSPALQWTTEEKAERGNIVLVSLSLHYFAHDGVNEDGINLNNKSFSPAAIIAAMHVGEEGVPETANAPYKLPMAGYDGNELLRAFERVQAKLKKKHAILDKKPGSGVSGLPLVTKGKVSFGK